MRNHASPSAMMLATFARVSTLSTRVGEATSRESGRPSPRARRGHWRFEVGFGFDDFSNTAPVGRSDPGERPPAVDRFEERGLFPIEVFIGTFEDPDLYPCGPPARRTSSIAARTRVASVVNDRLSATMTWSAATARGRDQRTFEHLVRVGAQDRPVLESTRLAFGAVDHHRGRLELAPIRRARCATCVRSGNPPHPDRADRGFQLRDQRSRLGPPSRWPARLHLTRVLPERAKRRGKDSMDNGHDRHLAGYPAPAAFGSSSTRTRERFHLLAERAGIGGDNRGPTSRRGSVPPCRDADRRSPTAHRGAPATPLFPHASADRPR